MSKGLFLVFEGGDGSGKTTVSTRLYEELNKKGLKCIYTREPGGIAISEKIREIILDKGNVAMDGRCEALLFAAARRQHLVEKVIPALEDGAIVLCDRFIDSSLVYQGYARGLGMDEIYEINQFAIGEYMPDLSIYFDIEPEEGLRRIGASKDREVNRLDLESVNFHNKVREGYKLVLNKYPNRVIEIDASKDKETVFNNVMKIIDSKLREKKLIY